MTRISRADRNVVRRYVDKEENKRPRREGGGGGGGGRRDEGRGDDRRGRRDDDRRPMRFDGELVLCSAREQDRVRTMIERIRQAGLRLDSRAAGAAATEKNHGHDIAPAAWTIWELDAVDEAASFYRRLLTSSVSTEQTNDARASLTSVGKVGPVPHDPSGRRQRNVAHHRAAKTLAIHTGAERDELVREVHTTLVPALMRKAYGPFKVQFGDDDERPLGRKAPHASKEDFVDTVVMYALDPEQLAARRPHRYTFVQTIRAGWVAPKPRRRVVHRDQPEPTTTTPTTTTPTTTTTTTTVPTAPLGPADDERVVRSVGTELVLCTAAELVGAQTVFAFAADKCGLVLRARGRAFGKRERPRTGTVVSTGPNVWTIVELQMLSTALSAFESRLGVRRIRDATVGGTPQPISELSRVRLADADPKKVCYSQALQSGTIVIYEITGLPASELQIEQAWLEAFAERLLTTDDDEKFNTYLGVASMKKEREKSIGKGMSARRDLIASVVAYFTTREWLRTTRPLHYEAIRVMLGTGVRVYPAHRPPHRPPP